MNQELLEIARQLRELSARLDALIAAAGQEPVAETEEAADPEAAGAEAPALPSAEEPAVPSSSPVKLTVNDRYRFMRELFGGDAGAMNRALADIEGLTSAPEVEAYVADALGLDLEQTVVAEFFAATTERFKSRPTLLA